MFATNAHPNLLTLLAEPVDSTLNTYRIKLRTGLVVFPLLQGSVRLGLQGLSLQMIPSDFHHVLPACTAQLQQTWPALQGYCLGNDRWRGFFGHGQLEQKEGLIQPQGEIQDNWRLEAIVYLQDIRLVEIEGLWPHDLTPNQLGVLDRVVAQSFYHLFPQPLSCLSVTPISPAPPGQTHPQSLTQCLETLTQPGEQPFLTLVAQTDLNPLEDLAGGHFLGVDWRNLDLSGANLARSNLRGADLSDGDFTEANFSHARLSGADLSGSLLSNAQLQGANLQRASLALANLSGADLRQVDLRGANLTQANFGSTQVAGIQWGENEGLTPELEAWLRSGSAISAS